MAKRENGYSPVKSWFETPEQRAEREQRLREKSAPLIKKWERTMTKEQYLQAVAEGRKREDIILKQFNNDPQELSKQLKDWGITEKEAVEMARVAKRVNVTKKQYLQRRLDGEGRTQILNTLGIGKMRAYELLKEWGIRELDAEERELELLASDKQSNKINARTSEIVEQKVEARSDQQWPAEVVDELEHADSGKEILKRMEQRAAAQEQELANLQAAVELWKNDAERKGEHIADLEAEIECFGQLSTLQSLEIARLESNKVDANHYREAAETTLEYAKTLESERAALLQTIERAASVDTKMITLQIPIMPVQIAVLERTRIYDALEALGQGIEGAEIDRQLVAAELFELLQRVVNFVTADLTELLPGQDATTFIHEFFKFYNDQHVQSLPDIKQAV